MTEPTVSPPITLSIAAVERDTGLSKDTLRVWERRYGFPAPERDALGERAYPFRQVEKLRIVRRLLDAGHRPGRIVPLALESLRELAEQTVDQPPRAPAAVADDGAIGALLQLIRAHDVVGLRAALQRLLADAGLSRFAADVVSPLASAVGDAWMRGQMEVFEEHLFTEVAQNVLRHALVMLPPLAQGRPRVLLSTLPGEQHQLGLLMAEIVLALEGCHCVSLGAQTPPWDLVQAAVAVDADIVALSFTGAMGPNPIHDGLAELRAKLPPRVGLWAGGTVPVLQRRPIAGVEVFHGVEQVPAALRRWRGQV